MVFIIRFPKGEGSDVVDRMWFSKRRFVVRRFCFHSHITQFKWALLSPPHDHHDHLFWCSSTSEIRRLPEGLGLMDWLKIRNQNLWPTLLEFTNVYIILTNWQIGKIYKFFAVCVRNSQRAARRPIPLPSPYPALPSQRMFSFLLRRPWMIGTSFGTLGTIPPFTDSPPPPPAKGSSIRYVHTEGGEGGMPKSRQ